MSSPTGLTADATAPPTDAADSPVARRRREEIVQAAADVIAGEGLHRLSLSRIEQRAGMSRGQLTYYFPTKEAILLAVFDKMLGWMVAGGTASAERAGLPRDVPGRPLDRLKLGLGHLLRDPAAPDPGPAGVPRPDLLRPLVHTFMAQASHRPDFRAKLAGADAMWRAHIARDVAAAAPDTPDPAAVASLVMAVFQGLTCQLAVDPGAFDRAAVSNLCVRLFAPVLEPPPGDSP